MTVPDYEADQYIRAEVEDVISRFGETWYHGTSEAAAAAILREGLKTDQDSGVAQPTEDQLDRIDFPYLWDGVWFGTLERAREHGEAVVAVNLRELIGRVYEVAEDSDSVDVCVVGSVAPEFLSRG